MDLKDWEMCENHQELAALRELPGDAWDAIRDQYCFTVLTGMVAQRQAIMIPLHATKPSIVVAHKTLELPQENRLAVLFHEFAHVYLKHDWPRIENADAEAEAQQRTEHWLQLWRERQA